MFSFRFFISLLESVYLIIMFLGFETNIDFNVFKSPKGFWFKHLTGPKCGKRICAFGRVAIFPFILVLISRHYIEYPQWFVPLTISISFVLSFMNLNAFVYLIPIWLIEIFYKQEDDEMINYRFVKVKKSVKN